MKKNNKSQNIWLNIFCTVVIIICLLVINDYLTKNDKDNLTNTNETIQSNTINIGIDSIPEYSGEIAIDINNNVPFFTKQEMTIEPDTTIFLYTDGLNEAEDPSHVLFGVQRIIRIAESLVKEDKNDPTTITNQMIEGVHRFVDGAEQSDDMTILAIKYGKRR